MLTVKIVREKGTGKESVSHDSVEGITIFKGTLVVEPKIGQPELYDVNDLTLVTIKQGAPEKVCRQPGPYSE